MDALNCPSLCQCRPAIAVNSSRGVIYTWQLQLIPSMSSRSVLRSSVSSTPTGTWKITISRPYRQGYSGVTDPWKRCKFYFFHFAFRHNLSPPTVVPGATDNQRVSSMSFGRFSLWRRNAGISAVKDAQGCDGTRRKVLSICARHDAFFPASRAPALAKTAMLRPSRISRHRWVALSLSTSCRNVYSSSLVRSSCSLNTKRYLQGNKLTTLPDGIFEDQRVLAEL